MRRTLSVISLLAALYAFPAWGAVGDDVRRRYIDVPETAYSHPIPVDTSAVKWTFEMRAAFESRSTRPSWGISWTDADGRIYRVDVSRAAGDATMTDEVTDSPALRIVATVGDSCLYDAAISKGLATASGFNTLTAEVSSTDITIFAGAGLLECVAGLSGRYAPVAGDRFTRSGDVSVDYAVIEEEYPAWRKVATSWTPDSLTRYAAEHSAISYAPEGLWRYLDREMDPAVARPGGKYQLVLVARSDGGYDILYYSGAETAADRWRCGMLKGVLTPSPFAGQYDLTWYDAHFRPHTDEAYATFSEGNRLLTISLPLLRATLRFARP